VEEVWGGWGDSGGTVRIKQEEFGEKAGVVYVILVQSGPQRRHLVAEGRSSGRWRSGGVIGF
jgi:hypothetical protein